MEEFTAQQAASYLSISREAVSRAVREGRLKALADTHPVRLARDAVELYHLTAQQRLMESFAGSGDSPVSLGRRVHLRLHPVRQSMPVRGETVLAAMPADVRRFFGKAAMAAACVKDSGACRWCKTLEFAAFLGGRPPEYGEGLVALFGGQQPCTDCGPLLLRPFMAALAARVHPGGVRPPGAAPRPSVAERRAAEEWVRQRPVTTSAQPVQDDNGKALVARRLREARTRLKDAKRRGDQKHAIRLRAMVASLEADAARVDGRVPSAADRPGTLRCGHALAAGCSCPRRGRR